MTYLCYPQQVSLAHAPPLLSFPISANADRHEVFRYPDRSGIQASFPVSRPKWHSGQCSDVQIEEVSDVQVEERHSDHGYFCVTIYFGIQVNILFQYSD